MKVGGVTGDHVKRWKCAQLVCYSDIHTFSRDDGTNRETTDKVQVCSNTLERIIVGVRKADKRNIICTMLDTG